jgi:hypothetical protein
MTPGKIAAQCGCVFLRLHNMALERPAEPLPLCTGIGQTCNASLLQSPGQEEPKSEFECLVLQAGMPLSCHAKLVRHWELTG